MDTESSVVLQEGGGVDGGGRGYGGTNGNGKNTIKILKIIKCFVILLKLPWGHYNYNSTIIYVIAWHYFSGLNHLIFKVFYLAVQILSVIIQILSVPSYLLFYLISWISERVILLVL